MNSQIGNIYNKQILEQYHPGMDDIIGKKYRGILGRIIDKDHPDGHGMIDLYDYDENIESKDSDRPFIYLKRSKQYDPYLPEANPDVKNYPKEGGWAMYIHEGDTYDGTISIDAARWLPNALQPYMSLLVKSRLFTEFWHSSNEWENAHPGVEWRKGDTGFMHQIYDETGSPKPVKSILGNSGIEFHPDPEVLGDPIRRLNELQQDLLIWFQGQFLYNMYLHPSHTHSFQVADHLINSFFSKIRKGLPERFGTHAHGGQLKAGEITDVEKVFEVWVIVWQYRLYKNIHALRDGHWSKMTYGDQTHVSVPGYKSTQWSDENAKWEPEEDDLDNERNFLKKHLQDTSDNRISAVDTPWEHI
jgi:hypothetical protein